MCPLITGGVRSTRGNMNRFRALLRSQAIYELDRAETKYPHQLTWSDRLAMLLLKTNLGWWFADSFWGYVLNDVELAKYNEVVKPFRPD